MYTQSTDSSAVAAAASTEVFRRIDTTPRATSALNRPRTFWKIASMSACDWVAFPPPNSDSENLGSNIHGSTSISVVGRTLRRIMAERSPFHTPTSTPAEPSGSLSRTNSRSSPLSSTLAWRFSLRTTGTAASGEFVSRSPLQSRRLCPAGPRGAARLGTGILTLDLLWVGEETDLGMIGGVVPGRPLQVAALVDGVAVGAAD